jgi:hypothetical protein
MRGALDQPQITHTPFRRIVMRNAVHSLMLVAVGLFQVVIVASMVLGH